MATVPSTGIVKFSNLRDVFTDTNPVKFSDYYVNAAAGLTAGVSGIPSTGTIIKVSQFRGKSKPGALYAFTSHTFTNASATGRAGPTLSQCRTGYTGVSWAQDSTNNWLNQPVGFQGIQVWTVPATGNYTIVAKGASGGLGGSVTQARGAKITGTFSLTQGEKIMILVGQLGGNDSDSPGGGGGTFVVKGQTPTNAVVNDILVIAGGGGGGSTTTGTANTSAGHGQNGASGGSTANYTGGSGGNAGPPNTDSTGNSTGGAGFLASGTLTNLCKGFVQGGVGGNKSVGFGGFGGGGYGGDVASSSDFDRGGGGGYSGGGASFVGTETHAGGGGSYNSGTSQTLLGGGSHAEGGHGYVTITKL